MSKSSITLSEAKQKTGWKMEIPYLDSQLQSKVINQCTQASDEPLQSGYSYTELMPRVYLLLP